MKRHFALDSSNRAFEAMALALLLLVAAFCGAARAENPNWSGTWDVRWAGGGARLILNQEGESVSGLYPFAGARLEGHVEGERLVGRWVEERGSWPISLVLASDGLSFMGRAGKSRWVTGSRIDPANADQALEISQASPQDTLRAFLVGGDAIRNGQLEFQDDVMHLLIFPEGTGGIDALREMSRFWLLLDQFFITPEDLSFHSVEGERATITMTRFDGRSFPVSFMKRDERWFIELPPAREVQTALEAVLPERGGQAPSENHVFKLSTPRDTMEAFLTSMRAGPGGLDAALRALNLSELSLVVREREAALLAQYLNEVLARIGEVVLQEIPNDPASREPYVHFVHPDGDIIIAPVETEKGVIWQFTPQTLRSIRRLFSATESLPESPHVLPFTAASTAPFFLIRNGLAERLPVALAAVGPLELWQWAALALLTLAGALGALVVGLLSSIAAGSRPAEGQAAPFFLTWGLRVLAFGAVTFAGQQLLGLPEHFAEVVKAISLVAIIAGAIPIQLWVVDAVRAVADRSGLISQHGEILANLVAGIVKIALIIGNFLLLAEALSIPYGAALAGLGIGGLAVALAARSTLENVISGFILFADRPLAVGDFCRFGERLGTVERIGIRSTAVRTLDRTLVSVPNADFVNLHLENFGRRDRILLHKTLALRYGTTPDQLRHVLSETRRLLIGHPKVVNDPAPRVRFAGFTSHALEVEIFAYVASTDWPEFLAIREDIFLRVMDVLDRSGTAFALPAQTLFLGRDAGLDAERAALAEAAVAELRREQRLPFPDFPAEEVAALKDRLSYPPEGAPVAEAGGPAVPDKGRRGVPSFWPFGRGMRLRPDNPGASRPLP